MKDIAQHFTDAMQDAGIATTAHILCDGKLHRFHIEGHKSGTLNGAYVLHVDGKPSGWFMDFTTGFCSTWTQSGKRNPMTAEMRKQIEYAREIRQKETEAKHLQAAQKARYIWDKATPISESAQHPYLTRKRINPHGSRLYNGALVIPLFDGTGELVNLQFIRPDGTKRFLSGGKKKGCSYYIGDLTDTILLAEGFATACSLHENTGKQTIVAFDAGNLSEVAKAVRAKHQNAEITIAGDNDPVGVKAANGVALSIGCKVLIPPIVDSDWNDYVNAGGAA
jgi:putative DNA primase/helicase